MSNNYVQWSLADNGVLTLTLSNPAARNAFDTAGQRQMVEAFTDAARHPGVRVVVLTGAGSAFCAGSDVTSMGAPDPNDPIAREWGSTPIWLELEARVDRLKAFAAAPMLLHQMAKPTIAMVRGPAAGAGLALALACDFRVASHNSLFSTAFAKIAMSGDYGGSYFLTKLIGPSKAKELYMLSDRISAEMANELGFLNRLVSDDRLEAETYALAGRMSQGPAMAYRYIKQNVHAALDQTVEQTFDMEARNMIRCRLTKDCNEAMIAFKEKRTPVFTGQ